MTPQLKRRDAALASTPRARLGLRLALMLDSATLWKVQDDTAFAFLLFAMAALHDLTPDQLKLATATLRLICVSGAAVKTRETTKGGAR